MVCWSHVIIEVYCARTWSTKKGKYLFEVIDLKKGEFKKKLNPSFDPNYATPKKPSFLRPLPWHKRGLRQRYMIGIQYLECRRQ